MEFLVLLIGRYLRGAKLLSIGRNPIPFIPFPLSRGRGNIERGALPLLGTRLKGR